MRKASALLLLTLAMLLCCGVAAADTVPLETIYATCDIPNTYVLLKADNLSRHPEWLANHNTTEADMLEDWNARGVLLQAWTAEGDACLEITAVRDETAVQVHDIDDQTPNYRAGYRRDHLSGPAYRDLGYNVASAEWKKTAQGRFLMLKYGCTQNGVTWRGYARKTIKNGYTITLDYKVFGRRLASKDNNNLNKVWNTWVFTQHVTADEVIAPLQDAPAVSGGAETGETVAPAQPAASTAHLKFTSEPPAETYTGKFAVEGTCDPNTHLVGVCMRMDTSEPVIFQADADKRGRFKLSVQLPQQGIWLMTLNAEQGGQVVEEKVFQVTTYQSNLLVVNFDQELPATLELTGDTLRISGTTVKQTTVQCMVDGGYNKQIRTNNSGKFSFTIDTSADGVYHISLTFSKKNYDTRTFSCTATRSISQSDMHDKAVAEAIKPAYATLVRKVQSYLNRIMSYRMYVVSIAPSGSGWLVTMAQRVTPDGYADYVMVYTEEEPTFEIDSQQLMYGTLIGTHLVQDSVNGDHYYPRFNLIFWGEN